MEKEQFNDFSFKLGNQRFENGTYDMMIGETPFAKRYNQLQKSYWVSTGRTVNPKDLMMEILVRDYNERNTPTE